ncbi:DUF429 domain-containing protein [Actinoplanes sp. NPDC051343]|uniref:DUF429 domain-containing protein n=1 Tax=Actinoplanes sp. NPDC051343 TaxID=3363906 RepID=UPI0037929B9A
MPPEPVWQQNDFTCANWRCRELTGTGLSRQARAMRPKALEAKTLWRHPTLLIEAHPEPSFARWPAGRWNTPRSHMSSSCARRDQHGQSVIRRLRRLQRDNVNQLGPA